MDLRRAIKRLVKIGHTWNHRLFRERKILIISDSHIISIPLKQRFQQVAFLALGAFLAWSFYSNGRFMAYQGLIAQKEIQVLRSTMENEELQQLYDSLQGEMQGMNDFLDELKKTTKGNNPAKANPKVGNATQKQQKQQPVRTSKADDRQSSLRTAEVLKTQMVDLRYGVSKKLLEHTKRMEATVAYVGLDLQPLLKKRGLTKLRARALRDSSREELRGVGGPYVPVSKGGKNKDPLRQRMDYLMALSQLMSEIPLGRPIESRHITSGFGVRTDPFTGARAIHHGVDMQGPDGTNIYTTAAGIVTYADRLGEYGNMVEIDHGNGVVTRYGHMKKVLVRKDQKVNLGAVVGTQGNTGRSSGTHVHYEVRINGKPRNPLPFLKAGGHV